MLAIKLQRIGKRHQPSYRIVVAEKRSKMAAPPVEDLGSYNPFTKAVTLNGERVSYWIKSGAQPTLTAHNLLVAQGVLSAPKRPVKIKKKEEAAEAEEAPKAEAPATQAEAAPAPESAPVPAEEETKEEEKEETHDKPETAPAPEGKEAEEGAKTEEAAT